MEATVTLPDGRKATLRVEDGPEAMAKLDAAISDLVGGTPKAEPATPQERFVAAAPGSSERVEANREMAAAEPQPQPPTILPTAGAILGGMGGAGVGSIPLAGLGAAGGQAVDQLIRRGMGMDAPETSGDAAKEIGLEGMMGIAAQAVGLPVGKAVSALASGVGKPLGRELLVAADTLGIPITAEKLSQSRVGQLARKIPGAGMMVRRAEEKAGPAIEEAAARTTAGLPPSQPPIDFGTQMENVFHAPSVPGVSSGGVLARARATKDAAYDKVTQLASTMPTARVPTFLMKEARDIQTEIAKQPPSLKNKLLQDTLDDIHGLYVRPKAGTPGGYKKLTYEELAAWQDAYADKAFHNRDPLYSSIERHMARLSNAAKNDIKAIPQPALQQAVTEADEVYKQVMAPFKKGQGRLSGLISGDSKTISDTLTGKAAPQVIRELRPHLQPEELKIIQGQLGNRIFDLSRDKQTKALVGSKLLDAAEANKGALREAFDEDFANEMVTLGRVAKTAQLGLKPQAGGAWVGRAVAGGLAAGLGFDAAEHGGGMIWHHPVEAASVVLPGAAIGALMGTQRGVRLLMTGLSGGRIPLEFGQRMGKAVTGTITGAITRGMQTGPASPKEETAEKFSRTLEAAFGPVVTKQIAAQKTGPAGEPPIAQIDSHPDPLDPIISASATDAKLSPQLVKATFMTESSMNPKATSPKGAQGVAQLMPALARSLGVRNPYDPTEAIPAATGHLANLMEKYKGDKRLALAAYNAGEPAVDRYGGVPPFKETQDYVLKVLKKERELEQDREKIVESAKKKPETWPAILKNYQEAKATGSKDAWKNFRSAISTHVNKQGGDPTLGMAPEEYQRWKPVLLAAMKPEPEQESTQGLDARSRKSNQMPGSGAPA